MTKISILILALAITLIGGAACAAPPATPPEDKTWLSPGKIQISSLSPGDRVEQILTIHNGNQRETQYFIYFRIPDYVGSDYVTAPDDAKNWVSIMEETPVLVARDTKEIKVVLALPDKAEIPQQWEFWIGLRENKEKQLSTELCSRWLIMMKE